MSNFSNMENNHQHDLDHDAMYTSSEQLLASLGETTLGAPCFPNPVDNFATSFHTAGNGPGMLDWNYGTEGLLEPLRRPEPGQMPPEVLASLFKTGRFSEILNVNNPGGQYENNTMQPGIGHGQSQPQSNFSPHGSDWVSSQNSNQSPNYSPQAMSSGGTPSPQIGLNHFSSPNTVRTILQPQQENPFVHSNLSPLAREFVPRQYPTQHQLQQAAGPTEHDMTMLTMAIAELNQTSNYQPRSPAGIPQQFSPQQQQQYHRFQQPAAQPFTPRGPAMRQQRHVSPRSHTPPTRHHHRQQFRPQQQPLQDFSANDFDSNADRVLTFVVDTITYLTHDPANFNSSMKKILRVLNESLTDSDTLEITVTLIVEQSVTNKNFFSTGARMCQFLVENKIKAGQLSAQNCIVKQVHEVFTSAIQKMPANSDALRERHIGTLMFLSELFVRYKTDGKLLFVFGVAVAEMIPKFLECGPTETPKHEHVRVVLNVLKLAGWELDQHAHPQVKEFVEKMYNGLSEVLEKPDLPANTKALVEKIFELRKINWGRVDPEPTATPPPSTDEAKSESPPSSSFVYGGKEHEAVYEAPSTDEEEEEVYLDEEAEKCFEQFLSETQSQG